MKKILSLSLGFLAPVATHAASLQNPLGDIDDPQALIIQILKYFLGLLALLGLLMFLYGGFMFLTSGGNAERVKKAKETIVWAAAGVITILGSYSILSFVFGLFK